MHPYDNNFGYLVNTENSVYQGAGLTSGAGAAGSAVLLDAQRSFVLTAHYAGVTGSPTATSISFALESSADGSAWHTCHDRDGNAITLVVTAAEKINSVNVDTQYFTVGDDRIRVTPTTTFTGGTSPTAYVAVSMAVSKQERM